MKIEDLEKALQYFVIAVPESEEQAKAYFWARKALTALRSMSESGEYHFRDDTKMVPLSLEQLNQMDGEPVWVVPLKKEDWDSHWDVMKHGCAIAESKTKPGKTYFLYEDSYRIRWLAYSYPPAHIDRSKWTAKWIHDEIESEKIGKILIPSCSCSICGMNVESETDFCPSCGRAMNEKAWAELERRLRG